MAIRFCLLTSPEYRVASQAHHLCFFSIWGANNDDRCNSIYNYSRNIEDYYVDPLRAELFQQCTRNNIAGSSLPVLLC
jgi:hypothetical protein